MQFGSSAAEREQARAEDKLRAPSCHHAGHSAAGGAGRTRAAARRRCAEVTRGGQAQRCACAPGRDERRRGAAAALSPAQQPRGAAGASLAAARVPQVRGGAAGALRAPPAPSCVRESGSKSTTLTCICTHTTRQAERDAEAAVSHAEEQAQAALELAEAAGARRSTRQLALRGDNATLFPRQRPLSSALTARPSLARRTHAQRLPPRRRRPPPRPRTSHAPPRRVPRWKGRSPPTPPTTTSRRARPACCA
jgi:hypothetical protein